MLKSSKAQTATRDDSSYRLRELGLLDAPQEKDFDAITALAKDVFNVSVALISIIDDAHHRQFFKSQIGLSAPWARRRQTPLTHSFCQYVRQFGEPLIVNDAKTHDLVKDNLAIRDLNVASYLGAPIHAPDGEPIGALCVIDDKPRHWTQGDVEMLGKLARCVSHEVRMKAAKLVVDGVLDDLKRKHDDTSRYNAVREWMCNGFMAPDLLNAERFGALLKNGCEALGMEMGVITKVDYDRVGIIFAHNLPQGDMERDYPISSTLSSFLVSGENQFHFRDVTRSNAVGWKDFLGNSPASFAGIPIVLDGQIFGTLELSSSKVRASDWTDEELSLLSMMSMLTCVYLGMVDKIERLERSEAATLIHEFSQSKRVLDAAVM